MTMSALTMHCGNNIDLWIMRGHQHYNKGFFGKQFT